MTQWISPFEALHLPLGPDGISVGEQELLRRLEAGLIAAVAACLIVDDNKTENAAIPPELWGRTIYSEAIDDWVAGSFSADIRGGRFEAIGVKFALESLLEIAPVEQRGKIRRSFSVAGNSDWLNAMEALRFVHDQLGVHPSNARSYLVEQCRQSFVSARSVAMRGKPDGSLFSEREWDIPAWFWLEHNADYGDWTSGVFTVHATPYRSVQSVTVSGAHFFQPALAAMRRSDSPISILKVDDEGDDGSVHPPVSSAALSKWWNAKSNTYDALSQDEILTLAKAAFPKNTITRERIRDMTPGRKRGRKPITPKITA